MMSNQRLQALMAQPCTRVCLIGEDGRYAAEAVELPGCYASGDTAAEAMTELEHAMVSWIEAELDEGHEIPPPSTTAYGGRLSLRIGSRLHERAVHLALAEGISLNRWLTTAIALYAGEQSAIDRGASAPELLQSPAPSGALGESPRACEPASRERTE